VTKLLKILFNIILRVKELYILTNFYTKCIIIYLLLINKENLIIISSYIFFIKYIPRLIVVNLFLLDVFYFQELHYFYLSLPFLILPLFLQYFIYICFKDHKSTISKLDETLLINNILLEDNPYGTNDFPVMIIKVPEYLDVMISYHLKGEKNPFEDDIDTSIHYFDTVFKNEQSLYPTMAIAEKHYTQLLYDTEKIHIVQHFIKDFDKLYEIKVNLILYSCYFIGWFYIMINLIFEIFPEYFLFVPFNYDPFSDIKIC